MWRRLPTWFPNIRLTMLPLEPEAKKQLLDCGWLREVAFRTEPRVNKLEIKAFLEAVHGMQVERVNTINYQGKKRQVIHNNKQYWKRESDWKKAYVIFKPPKDDPKVQEIVTEWEQQKHQRQLEAYHEWKQQQQHNRQQRKQQMARLLPSPAAQEAVVAGGRAAEAAGSPAAAGAAPAADEGPDKQASDNV
eukprot:GHUV01006490.1.p1 GENE.GHUV01006490.1~~GHUV01006490.1.p1  ORF type:complete len:191 (+),score=71.96 GHUV01006490.1:237-809(+)